MRRKKERSKQMSNKQTRQSNTAHPRQSLFLRKMSCLWWDSNPRHSNMYIPGWKGAREYAQFRGISAVFRVITRQSRVFFSRVFAFSRPNTVRTRVISPIDGRETARKRSDNINTFYVLFAPAREFIRETA